MNRGTFMVIGILAIVMGLTVSSAAFTVHRAHQAIVLQFGNPKRVVTQPGLHLKLPFVQNVLYYEKRVLGLKAPGKIVVLGDRKRVLVETFARYRIGRAGFPEPVIEAIYRHMKAERSACEWLQMQPGSL